MHDNAIKMATTAGSVKGVELSSSIDSFLGTDSDSLALTEKVRLYEIQKAYENQNATSSNLAGGDAKCDSTRPYPHPTACTFWAAKHHSTELACHVVLTFVFTQALLDPSRGKP